MVIIFQYPYNEFTGDSIKGHITMKHPRGERKQRYADNKNAGSILQTHFSTIKTMNAYI